MFVVAITGDEPLVVIAIVLPDSGIFVAESTNLPDAV